MAEILKNTGAKLWSMVDDHDELQSNVFDQLFGTGGKSDIRLIDEAIGKINESLNGYYFKIINDKLYICKDTESGTTSLPLSITDDDGHVALKVDGTSITIDGNGVVHGATVDDAFSLTSENAIQNKVVKAKFDEVDGKINANETTISSHKNDKNNPHSVTKEQVGLGNVEDKSSETIRGEITKDNVTTALGYTPYTPNEVDNKFSTLETNIDWKEAVNTFDDIATTYPNPEDGWTVNTKDDNITYRYNGTEWIAISANAIPKATDSVDGLLSKEDHAKYDDAASKAHIHDNKSVLDGITSNKVTAWDTVNNKVDKVDGKGLSTEDYTTDEKNKLSGIADGANKTIVDSSLDTSSENPVQNKVIAGEINTLKKSVSDGKTKVANAITDKGVETATDATFDVMAENISKIETGGGELHGAIISVSTEEETLIGKEVTLSKDEIIIDTKAFDENGICSFTDILEIGAYVISSTDGVEETASNVDITQDNIFNKTVVPCELSFLKIVTFADGTDAEIAKMIQAHYDNKINIADYWAVGDTRSVSLSAMSATGVSESHRAQTVQFVIGDFNHDDLATHINGHTKAAVTLLQKDCLMDATSASNVNNGSADTEKGYMNSTNTNVGGWKNCARRTWCNNVFFVALPSVWQSMVKTVNKKTSIGNNQSTIETVQDKIFLAAEIEIFGSTRYSFAGEGTQYQYYKNATANRYKMPKWGPSTSFDTIVSNIYWDRSPGRGGEFNFCAVLYDGGQGIYTANSARSIAPCLCI